MNRGRYYLGRVLKLGQLQQSQLINAMLKPKTISVGQFKWTFIDTVDRTVGKEGFIFSRLAKYSQEGHVTVVDTTTNSQRDAIAKNLLVASSPFVYLPAFSGIAYLHVWNGLEESVFRRRFKNLIEKAYDSFFVNCEIEPIADYQAFVSKLNGLEQFSEIQATVHPPNPLFGHLWEDLHKYMKSRNATEVQVEEKSDSKGGLNTNLINLFNSIEEGTVQEFSAPATLTDAALLMAADGYGSGKVVGLTAGEKITIRTTDTQKSFLFDKEPTPEDLAVQAQSRLTAISQEREMKHD